MKELAPLPDDAKVVLATTLGGQNIIAAYEQYMEGEEIGSNTGEINRDCAYYFFLPVQL